MSNLTTDTKFVIDEARFVAASNWTGQTEEGAADKEAKTVTSLWQKRLQKIDPDRFKSEVLIRNKGEKIDVIDCYERVAYELKVSGKNPGHEFYKDLFKVLIYNQNHKQSQLKAFVFITQGDGVKNLENGLGKIAADFLQQFNIKVELTRLD